MILHFLRGGVNYIIYIGEYKLFSLVSGVTVDHFIGELSGADLAGVLRQDVK